MHTYTQKYTIPKLVSFICSICSIHLWFDSTREEKTHSHSFVQLRGKNKLDVKTKIAACCLCLCGTQKERKYCKSIRTHLLMLFTYLGRFFYALCNIARCIACCANISQPKTNNGQKKRRQKQALSRYTITMEV